MINLNIVDGKGTKKKAHVTKSNALLVSLDPSPLPAASSQNVFRYLQGRLGNTGLESGVTNMNVDGNQTPIEFFILANAGFDIHIMSIAILLSSNTVSHKKFGNIAALTNGLDITLIEAGFTTKIINSAKTGGELIAQSGFRNPYGDANTTWALTDWSLNNDATTIYIPLSDYIPEGLRIGRGTKDKLSAFVNDDLTSLSLLEVRLFGYKHFPVGEET